MTNINILHVSAPECHPQGVFQIKAIQAKHAYLRMHLIIATIEVLKLQNT